MTMTTLQVLERARELIARPGGWTQGAMARRADGSIAASLDPVSGCSFCAGGAVLRATNERWEIDAGFTIQRAALISVKKAAGVALADAIACWNDDPDRTQAEVVDAFDRAIAAERAKVQP